MKLEFSRQISEKNYANIKFNENPSSGSRVVPYGRTDMINPLNAELNPICHLLALLGGATIIVVSRLRVKLMVAFRNFAECA
jgi:hypothetical protein